MHACHLVCVVINFTHNKLPSFASLASSFPFTSLEEQIQPANFVMKWFFNVPSLKLKVLDADLAETFIH